MDSENSFESDNYNYENHSQYGDSIQDEYESSKENSLENNQDSQQNSSEIDDMMFQIEEENQNKESDKKREQVNSMKKLAPYPNIERITSPYLTKYEKAFILGKRASMIEKNSPIYVIFDENENIGPLGIAQRQLQKNVIPFVVRRFLPNGQYEDWKLSELIK